MLMWKGDRHRKSEGDKELATKSFWFGFFFFFVFGLAQLSDNLKLIGFHVCQNVQDLSLFPSLFLYVSVCVCVFCLEGAAQSVGSKREKGLQIGQLLVLWLNFFLHILCAVFHAK